jgi:hypothetical protein
MFQDLEKGIKKHLLFPLSIYTTCQVLKFLDYKTIMTKIRYLNKSFIWLTQETLQYIEGLNKQAILRASLKEIYEGTVRMPIVNHPYYTNCERLKIIYQVLNKENKYPTDKKHKLLRRFMEDLFTRVTLFPNIKYLYIHFSHNQ